MKTQWLDRRIAAPGPYLALCLSPDEFKAACKDIKCAPPPFLATPQSQATAHVFEHRGKTAAIVCISDWQGRDPVEVAGLLVHEAVHIWQQYAADIGERYPGAEQEAYAIQSIAQELMSEFARRQSHHA